ncbi:MAG: LapA family protein [Rhizonema sp. NSF051]|nr:LapA family protein [Rhizonema sp. NSF051]
MRSIANLLTSTVLACWVVAIAVLSVQNAQPVSIKFLTFESIKIPVGLVLAFCAGVGIIGMALLQPLLEIDSSVPRKSTSDDADFFVDDDF